MGIGYTSTCSRTGSLELLSQLARGLLERFTTLGIYYVTVYVSIISVQ